MENATNEFLLFKEVANIVVYHNVNEERNIFIDYFLIIRMTNINMRDDKFIDNDF